MSTTKAERIKDSFGKFEDAFAHFTYEEQKHIRVLIGMHSDLIMRQIDRPGSMTKHSDALEWALKLLKTLEDAD